MNRVHFTECKKAGKDYQMAYILALKKFVDREFGGNRKPGRRHSSQEAETLADQYPALFTSYFEAELDRYNLI